MSQKFAQIKGKQRSIILTFLLLFTIPVFVFSIIENRSFDPRNKAFEEIELSSSNPCIITFPNVNPYTLEINNTVRIQVDGLSENSTIKEILITDGLGSPLFTKIYETEIVNRVTESFLYTPKAEGAYKLTGTLTDTVGKSFVCVVSSPYDIQGVKAIASNTRPEFTTTPKASKPSQNIKAGETYEYTLEAKDIDKDTINYSYSFTKGETWLKPTIIKDGGNGELTIKFRGSTKKPGSYLANVFIHDGYSRHLSSQSWVISVNTEGNDNPVVTIIDPVSDIVIKEEKSITLSWEANDDNPILKYQVYISSNPANELAWEPLNENIPPSQTSYVVDLSELKNGAYRLIVRAIDNQDPAGVGMDISKEILISREEDDDFPDDSVVLPEPQIINMSPTSTDTVSNTTPTIRASLIATEDATIVDGSILFEIDNRDITSEIQINKISDSEHTVIYIPESPLTSGLHKITISFKDSNGGETEKEWAFTISTPEEDEDSDSFNIFGFEIPKRTLFIVLGGIALIILAILIPLLIPIIWKEKSSDVTPNSILPESMPITNGLPSIGTPSQIQQLTKEDFKAPEPEITSLKEEDVVFEAPEPDLLSEDQNLQSFGNPNPPSVEGITPMYKAPEPEEDLTNLYQQIKDLEEKDKN